MGSNSMSPFAIPAGVEEQLRGSQPVEDEPSDPIAEVKRAIRAVVVSHSEFTADDVVSEAAFHPDDQLLGVLLKEWAVESQLCFMTSRRVQSRTAARARAIAVWQSLVYDDPEAAASAEASALLVDAEVTSDYIRLGRMTLHRESRGYGLVCAYCRCEVDAYIRGPHDKACPMRMSNSSLLPGAEAFAEFERLRS